jgi:O-antigen ligase
MALPLNTFVRKVPRWIPFLILFEIFLGFAVVIFHALLPIILSVGIFGFLLLLIKPQWGYYLTILALAFDGIAIFAAQMPGVPGAKTLNAHHIFILITFIVLLIQFVRDKLEFKKTGLEIPLLLFLAWLAITLIWTPDFKNGALSVFRTYVAVVFFYCTVQLFREEKYLRGIITIWFILGFIDMILTFTFPHGFKFTPFIGLQWTKSVLGRARAFTNQPNTLATQLDLTILLGFGLFFAAKSRLSKWFYGSSVTFMSLAFILTISRGWLVALPIGITFFFYKMGQLKRFTLFIIASVAIIGIFFLIKPDVVGELIWRFFRAPQDVELTEIQVTGAVKSVGVRSVLWGAGYDFFKETYGRGIGAGGFATIVGGVIPEIADMQLHSLYFTVTFELGLIGLLLFLWLMALFLWRVELFSKQIKGGPVAPLFFAWYAGWVTILLNGFLRITLGSIPFWSFLSLGIVMITIDLDKKKEAEQT